MSPTGCVNSIPHIQQNYLKNGHHENNNYNKSNVTSRETNYSINNNTRYMQLSKHYKYTNDDVHTDACVVHIMR